MIISYWTEKVFMCLGTSGKARPVLLCAIFAPSNAEVPIRARGADFSVLKLKSYRIAVPGRAWGRREMCECIDIYARCSRAHGGEILLLTTISVSHIPLYLASRPPHNAPRSPSGTAILSQPPCAPRVDP